MNNMNVYHHTHVIKFLFIQIIIIREVISVKVDIY